MTISTLMPAWRPETAPAPMPRMLKAALMLLLALMALMTGSRAFARDDGEWLIERASYGTLLRNIDVTDTLRQLASRDDRVRVTNELFGNNDPAYGQEKTLRIVASNRAGERRTFEFREGSVIDGNNFIGWRGGDWGRGDGGRNGDGRDDGTYVILGARYGVQGAQIDVTSELRRIARSDARVRVTNDLFRDDPAEGRTKTLRIFVRNRNTGEERYLDYREGSWIDGNQFVGWGRGDWGQGGWNGGWDGRPGGGNDYGPPSERLTIVRATYGSGGRYADVTERLRNISRGGRLDVRADNDLAGGDPAYGESKVLTVYYVIGRGREQTAVVREGDRLRLP